MENTMRQITRDACTSLLRGEPFRRDNTHVDVDDENRTAALLLHGNTIVTYWRAALGGGTGASITISDGGYPLTLTTKERLNGVFDTFGLPYRVETTRGVNYVRDVRTQERVAWDGDDVRLNEHDYWRWPGMEC